MLSGPQPFMVWVALGGNVGPVASNFEAALNRLKAVSRGKVLCSSFWSSSPVDCPPGSPDFLNAAAVFSPIDGLTPFGLLDRLQAWERELGRRSKLTLNEPRPLDLDLIAWGEERIDTPILVLPHPRAHLRRFVLQPIAEIRPDLVLPGQTLSVTQLLAALPAGESLQRWRESPDGPAPESAARG